MGMKLWKTGTKRLVCIQLGWSWNIQSLLQSLNAPWLHPSSCRCSNVGRAHEASSHAGKAKSMQILTWILFNRKPVIFLPGYIAMFQKRNKKRATKGALGQKLELGMYKGSGTDLWVLDGAQASDQGWTEPCVYFATLAVCPSQHHRETQRTRQLQDKSPQ